MSEAFTGPESAPQVPQADPNGRETPGYPPPGQQEVLAALRQQEAATRGEENPDAVLAGLENVNASAEGSSNLEQKIRQGLELASHSSSIPAERLSIALADINLTDEQRSQLEGNLKLMGMLRRPELNDNIKDDCLQCIAEVVPLGQASETNLEAETRQAQLAVAESRNAELETDLAETQASVAEREANVADQLQTIDEVQSEQAVEATRLAAENDRADAEAERADANAQEVVAFLKSKGLSSGSLDQYQQAAADIINAEYEGQQRDNALEALDGFIEGHRATLNQIETLLTEEERQQVFGGALTETVSLNFGASSQADIYANVFTAIEAGPLSDSRKQELIRQVEQQLGRPANARQLKDVLTNGRGTEAIQELQQVEEPPGSGQFVERLVTVGERVIPFTAQDRLVMNEDPRIEVYLKSPGSTIHIVEAQVPNGSPVRMTFGMPQDGPFPAAAITDQINSLMVSAQWRGHGLSGALEALVGQGNATAGIDSTMSLNAQSGSGVQKALERMLLGENTVSGNRFYTGAELHRMGQGLRWLAIDGAFGGTNQVDGSSSIKLMTALFGDSPGDIITGAEQAMPHVNSGGIESPSFQQLYAKLNPDDAANGFARLEKAVGARLFAQMKDGLPKTTGQ